MAAACSTVGGLWVESATAVSHDRKRKKAQPAPPAALPVAAEPRPLLALWLVAGVLTFWSFGFTTMMGSDLWWHLASGRWIWTHGTLNFKDPWSFTRYGQPWMSHEWLSDLIYHGWASAFGMATLVWWKWLVLVGAFLTLLSTLRRLAGSLPAYLTSAFAMAVGAPFFDLRPQLYSVLGFAVLLRVGTTRTRWRWLLPLGFAIWVNLHGGFFFGLLVLTVMLALARLLGHGTRNDVALWLACLGAALVNPAGPDAYVFPLHYALNPSSPYLRVGEWIPPWEPGGIRSALYFPALGLFLAAAVATFAARLHRQQPRPTYTALALGLLTLAMSLKSRRFIPLFAIASSLTVAPALAIALAAARRRVTAWRPALARWGGFVLAGLAVLFGAWRLLPYPRSSAAFLYLTAQDGFPVEALNVIETNQLTGKVFAFYQWGGYVNLRTDGRLRVFIDGRADTVFDDSIYRRYTRVLQLGKGWQTVVDTSGADFVLWPRRHPKQIEGLLATGDWRTLYADRIATLLVRDGYQVPERLLPSPDSPWRELTLGWRASAAKRLPEAEAHFQRALERMPNLRAACEWLANTRALADRMAEAEATLDHCQRMFPDRDRRRELLEHFRQRSEAD